MSEPISRDLALEIITAYRDKLKNSVSNQLDTDILAFDYAIICMKFVDAQIRVNGLKSKLYSE